MNLPNVLKKPLVAALLGAATIAAPVSVLYVAGATSRGRHHQSHAAHAGCADGQSVRAAARLQRRWCSTMGRRW